MFSRPSFLFFDRNGFSTDSSLLLLVLYYLFFTTCKVKGFHRRIEGGVKGFHRNVPEEGEGFSPWKTTQNHTSLWK